jgi:uncharacterized protein YegP (UPF0339 family)
MKTHVVTVFRDKKGTFRWNLKSKNNLIVADSAEGYANRGNANRAAKRLPVDWKKVEFISE